MTESDKANVEAILHGQGDWFTARLLRLIAKADQRNREKIYEGFPEEVEAVHMFLTGKAFDPSQLDPPEMEFTKDGSAYD